MRILLENKIRLVKYARYNNVYSTFLIFANLKGCVSTVTGDCQNSLGS